ncbi:MAG: beta-ketoacyl synthase N-terminal-like domain-containing protein, partial [Granulosicoccus sp.]
MNKSLDISEVPHEDDSIAIVGIGCRFPGGVKDPDSFWDLIVNARDGVVDVPTERWDSDRFYDEDTSKHSKMFVNRGGFIDQPIDAFDTLFFGISPREAERMDPQQRLLLETSWEAMEDAGLAAEDMAGTNTGVFIGAFNFDNQVTQMGIESRHLISSQTPTSSTFTMLSNRLSYFYDFRGPSITMDTACSSSLVALHQACQSLRQGDCDQALCGGVNVMFRPETFISMCKGKFLSPDGRSKSFDSRANG